MTLPTAPVIVLLDPASGGPSQVVNIDGRNFSSLPGANVVHFGGMGTAVLGASGGRLNVLVPAGMPPGQVDVLVITNGISSNSKMFQVLGPRQAGISRVIPPSAPWGSLLALDGANLLGNPTSISEVSREDTSPTVSFPAQGGGTVAASIVSSSVDRLIVQVPPTAASGDVTLTTSDGQTSNIPFQVSSDPFGRPLPAGTGIQSLFNAIKKPVDLAIDPSTQLAYVVMSGVARVEAFTTVTEVVDTTPVTFAQVGLKPMQIALDLTRRLGFVTNSVSNTVSAFRLPDNVSASQLAEKGPAREALVVERTFPSGNKPLGISVDAAAGLLAVANNQDNTVSIFSLDSYANVATLPVGEQPIGVAFDTLGRRLYVSSAASESISVIDTGNLRSLDSIRVGPGLGTLVFDPLTEKLAVVASDSNLVYIVNPESGSVKTVAVGAKPQDLAINSTRHSLLVINQASQSLSEVDMATAAVVSEVPLGSAPVALDYDIVNNRGLIINSKAATLPTLNGDGRKEQDELAGFSVVRMPAQLNFPRLLNPSHQEEIGLAMANLSAKPATLVLTALTNSGLRLDGPGLTNPRNLTINAGSQQAILPQELFGVAVPADGWIRVQTDAADLKGFFLSFDDAVRYLDGAVESGELVQKAIFPALLIGVGASTEITLVNENPIAASASLTLMGKAGNEISKLSVSVPAYGALRRNVQDLLPEADSEGYLQLSSILPLRAYEQFGASADIAALNAIKTSEATDKLVFAQFAAGGGYFTTATVVNLESEAQQISISALDDSGQLIARSGVTNPQSFELSGKGKLIVDLARDMGLGGDSIQQGSLQVTSTQGGSIAGYASYGTARALVTVAAQTQPRGTMVFSHVAETVGDGFDYFTGVALLNPNSSAIGVQVVVYRPDGSVVGAWDGDLPPGGRISKLLRELPGIGNSVLGLTGGFFRVTATESMYGLALFGTGDLAALAAIPPQ